jgi:hypothetical protein
MELRRQQEDDPRQWKTIRRGWCLGSPQFREQLIEKLEGSLCDHHCGEVKQETSAAKAQRILREELKRHRWKESDLALRRKSDPIKVEIALRVRAETTLSIQEIAKLLRMGSWSSLNRLLYESRKERKT